MKSSRPWFQKGKRAIVIGTTTRANTTSIPVFISAAGLIKVGVRKNQEPIETRKNTSNNAFQTLTGVGIGGEIKTQYSIF